MTLKLGTTLYSLTNEFHSLQYNFAQLVAQVGARGIGPGLEVVGFQSIRGFPAVSAEFEHEFRSLVDQHGLTPSCLGINADVNTHIGHPMSDDAQVDYHQAQILAAGRLGFPVVRCQFPAGPAVLERLVPFAEKHHVVMGLEIYAPATLQSFHVVPFREMFDRVQSPVLGFVPDFGTSARAIPPTVTQSFLDDGVTSAEMDLALSYWEQPGEGAQRMGAFAEAAGEAGFSAALTDRLMLMFGLFGNMPPEDWAEIMPQVVHIHGKFFDFDAAGNELAVDYPRTLKVFLDAGYDGFMSSEYEGHHFLDVGGLDKLERHHALCRRIIADHAH